MIAPLTDFRGGYFTDVPSELLKNSDLLQAENCTWKNGLTKRSGIAQYSVTSLSGDYVGAIRGYFNSAYYTIVARDSGSSVIFYHATTTALTEISGETMTTGSDVQMAYLNGYVVAVNGVDKPLVIYYDSGWQIQTLEALDERTLYNSDWWAGQYDASESPEYIDDTVDAQDTNADDWQLASTTNNDGFYISSSFTFNKVIFDSCSDFGGSPVADYEYWDGSAWSNLSMVTSPSWTASEGDKTMEFNFPTDWEVTPETEAGTSNALNRWTIRVRFTTAPSAAGHCNYATLYHTQKLTELLAGSIPHDVFVHKSHMFLAEGYNLQYARTNMVTQWPSNYVEHFTQGGPTIKGLASFKDRLLVFKDSALYEYTGDSFENFVRRRVSDYGTVGKRSIASAGSFCYRLCRDGIYAFNGSQDVKVSKHIQTDIDSYTLTDAAAVNYKGDYWVSFPTNEVALTCDPDTMRQDDVGDMRASFFKFTNYQIEQFINCSDSADTGFLLGISNQATPYLARCDNGATDATPGAANIDMKIKTIELPLGTGAQFKHYTRIKPVVKQDSGAGTTYTFTMYADSEARSDTVTLTVAAGTGNHTEDISMHYDLDGKNLSLYLRNNSAQTAGLMAFYFEVAKKRRF